MFEFKDKAVRAHALIPQYRLAVTKSREHAAALRSRLSQEAAKCVKLEAHLDDMMKQLTMKKKCDAEHHDNRQNNGISKSVSESRRSKISQQHLRHVDSVHPSMHTIVASDHDAIDVHVNRAVSVPESPEPFPSFFDSSFATRDTTTATPTRRGTANDRRKEKSEREKRMTEKREREKRERDGTSIRRGMSTPTGKSHGSTSRSRGSRSTPYPSADVGLRESESESHSALLAGSNSDERLELDVVSLKDEETESILLENEMDMNADLALLNAQIRDIESRLHYAKQRIPLEDK